MKKESVSEACTLEMPQSLMRPKNSHGSVPSKTLTQPQLDTQ